MIRTATRDRKDLAMFHHTKGEKGDGIPARGSKGAPPLSTLRSIIFRWEKKNDYGTNTRVELTWLRKSAVRGGEKKVLAEKERGRN